MEGKGLSPKVDVLLKDNGDSFGIDTMSLIDVGVTKSPRKIRLLNSDITGETGATGNPNPEPTAPQPQPPAKDTNVATTLLLEKLQGKDAEIGKLQDEINSLKEEDMKSQSVKLITWKWILYAKNKTNSFIFKFLIYWQVKKLLKENLNH